MKGSGENKVFIGGEFAQPRLKFTLVDQSTGLVNYDEGEDGPRRLSVAHPTCSVVIRAHMMAPGRWRSAATWPNGSN